MCIQFLCARYPQYFSVDVASGVFRNKILNQVTDLKTTTPLAFLLDNVPEDFAIMMRDPKTGYYFFRAGVICRSIGRNLGSKTSTGQSPTTREKRAFPWTATSPSCRRTRQSREAPGRSSSTSRCTSTPRRRTRPSTTARTRPRPKRASTCASTGRRGAGCPSAAPSPSTSRAFNFTGLFTPLGRLGAEPRVPALALKVLTKGKAEMLRYKGVSRTDRIVIPAQRGTRRSRFAAGGGGGVGGADAGRSPFFPGWEAAWRGASHLIRSDLFWISCPAYASI